MLAQALLAAVSLGVVTMTALGTVQPVRKLPETVTESIPI